MRFSLFRFTFPVFHNILIIDPPHESRKPYCPGLLQMCIRDRWFTRDEIVEYGPYISVGHEMMKAFKDGRI